jgi:hypothetical protein
LPLLYENRCSCREDWRGRLQDQSILHRDMKKLLLPMLFLTLRVYPVNETNSFGDWL